MFKHEQANTLLSAVAFQGGVERRRVASCFTYSHPLTHNNIFFIYIYIPLSLTLLFLAPSSTYSINHSTHIDVISLRGQSFHGPRFEVAGPAESPRSKVAHVGRGPRSSHGQGCQEGPRSQDQNGEAQQGTREVSREAGPRLEALREEEYGARDLRPC